MEKKQHVLLLGAHMSIAGGFEKAIERGESIDCTAIQIFTKTNRQWHAAPITQQEADLFRTTVAQSKIQKNNIIAHCSYLLNLGSPESEIQKKSIAALVMELNRCHILGIPYLVLHPGSHVGSGEATALSHIARNIDAALETAQEGTMILLENMAGQGSVVCSKLEQLAIIQRAVRYKSRIGFCFDTCHAFAAGYDLTNHEVYEVFWREYDSILGLSNLKAMHINDSKKELGCLVDRHEEIGKGKLGLESFRLLFNDPRFFDVPKILETPNDELADYAKNMDIIKELLSKATREKLKVSEE